MNAKDAVLTRRSVRKYKTDPVPKELIEQLVLAGRSAPTANNRQEIKIYVIANDAKKIRSIADKVIANRAKIGKQGGWMDEYKKKYQVEDVIFYDAPCMIVLVADKTEDKRVEYWYMMDAGIVSENIMIMANGIGLGSVPIGIANDLNQEAVLDGIGADKNKEELLLAIPFGYPVDGYKEKYGYEKKLTSFVKYV